VNERHVGDVHGSLQLVPLQELGRRERRHDFAEELIRHDGIEHAAPETHRDIDFIAIEVDWGRTSLDAQA
jgi:hypothetical protein